MENFQDEFFIILEIRNSYHHSSFIPEETKAKPVVSLRRQRAMMPARVRMNITADDLFKDPRCQMYVRVIPEKREVIRKLINHFSEWATTDTSPDFYFSPEQSLPQSGDWGVDDSFSETCASWEDARLQMGTTGHKYSLTTFCGENACSGDLSMFSALLNGLGFGVMEANFTVWRLGYDYKLHDIYEKGQLASNSEWDYQHICVFIKHSQ